MLTCVFRLGQPLVLAASLLAADPLVAAERDAPWGRLIEVDGRQLHLYCEGRGSPTVLLEAGLGANFLDWRLVQPALAAHTRICAYDRAGYGWSEPGEKPRTLERLAREQAALADAAGLGPLVIVGHSLGGLVALEGAALFPDRVIGLVLVDSMHPDQFARFAEAGVEIPTEPTRATIFSGSDVLVRGIPQELSTLALRLAEPDTVRSAMYSELRSVTAGIAALRPLLPVTVRARIVRHGSREWDAIHPDGRMEDVWAGLQADLAAMLDAPPPAIALGAGHAIPLEAPDAVVAAVLDLLASLPAGP